MTDSGWIDIDDREFGDTLLLIDPELPDIVRMMISEDGVSNVSEVLHRISNVNPLGLGPSEKDRYRLMVGRMLLDIYIRTGFDPTDQETLEMVRMPGRTKCCNPYSDNMYRHLIDTTVIESSTGRFRLIFG